MPTVKSIKQINVLNKKILLRVDFNVPLTPDNKIADNTKIISALPTIEHLLQKNAKIKIISHIGRPKGKILIKYSLKIVYEYLKQILDIEFIENYKQTQKKQVALLENLRFYKQEEENSREFAEILASQSDIYINEAFSCSHRAHASIVQLPYILPSATGLLFQKEINALTKLLTNNTPPTTVIISGSKISTKIKCIQAVMQYAQNIILGSAIAIALLQNKELHKKLQIHAKQNNCTLIIPNDFIQQDQTTKIIHKNQITTTTSNIYDIGPEAIEQISLILNNSKTILWNGPLGLFETKPFDNGTIKIGTLISSLTKKGLVTSIVGGGDTILAIKQINAHFSHISTGGGAFLSWLTTKNMPGILALHNNNNLVL